MALEKKRDGTTIYLVHHGRTPWDLQDKVHGWSQMGLAPEGKDDAKKAAEFLATEGVGEVYSSDLKRAIETAEIIRGALKIEKPNTERVGLRPMDVGLLKGLTAEEAEEPMDDLKSRLWASAPGGESVGKFLGRWGMELHRTIQEALGEDHACAYVTHSHNLATIAYLLSTGVAPIRLHSPVGPGGIIGLHVSDGGGQVISDHLFDQNPVGVSGN